MKLLAGLWSLLPRSYRSKFIFVQILSITSAISEVITLAAFIPLVQLLTSSSEVSIFWKFSVIEEILGLGISPITLVSVTIAILVIFNAIIQIIAVRVQTNLSSSIGIYFSSSLYDFLLRKDYLDMVKDSSSGHINKIIGETNRFSDLVLFPILQLITKAVLVIVISFALIKTDIVIFSLLFTIIGGFYLGAYLLFKNLLNENGITVSREGQKRIKILQETIGSGKEIEITNSFEYFGTLFKASSSSYFKVQRLNQLIAFIPRYIMEVVFVITFLLLVQLLKAQGGAFVSFLPKLTFFAMASMKLLPQLQTMFLNFSLIKSNISAYLNVKDDLKLSLDIHQNAISEIILPEEDFNKLSIENVSFNYSNGTQVLNNINVTIFPGTLNAITGDSGGGKSTFLNIMMGLFSPTSGSLRFNETLITKESASILFKRISYVSQKVFLLESTISENIAFGIVKEKINVERVMECLKMAELYDFIASLENGIDTFVGEGGNTLSGGQIQRLGIARALYRDPEIIFLDESTSSLDEETEKQLMKTIFNLRGIKTVVFITHKVKYLQGFDNIFRLKNGHLEKAIINS